ncbi:cell cycle progression protein 1 isoform X1 [Hyla sarda]|nr:cell cycle progression protein 1 isoform X1 [Hyla sarda]XP_056428336.1 cell cycle progression protein 1 isoform X1 [Hyla sarda]XP_056428337.1 cell cycle progression protein 1 isoform X1 [Hyla sarda]XP_056428338.1 cell cycle progression protein 1 isoform X1 [Hyla sarda]XP_056428339.1 cell cycle progression protein 1 isoform X1 [Hyla sarda]
MSGNSSDSESSCGWTILNHEGSDIETLPSEVGPCPDLAFDHSTTFVDNVHPDSAGVWSNEVSISNVENLHYTPEDQQGVTEQSPSCGSYTNPVSSPVNTEDHHKQGAVGEDSHCEAVSDDSDIVTLEPPKVDEVGPLEEEIPEDLSGNKDLNMSFSSSSQYTFSQPETVFPSRPSEEDSSNDEASDDSGPILRRRRSRKSTTSGSESENRAPTEQPPAPAPRTSGWMSSGLNKCIILALVIAISMGFGHFYGTIQILERQRYVEKILESELNEMKDDLHQCQREQEVTVDHEDATGQLSEDFEEKQDLMLSLESLMVKITKENHMLKQKQNELKLEADDIAANLKTTEVQNRNLALENQHLRESLEKEEQALSSLKEELRKLREQIRNLDEKGRHEIMQLENQKLKEHLKEERQKVRTFRTQKESLLNDAQLLRKELDNERTITDSLRVELEEISKRRSASSYQSDHEIEHLKDRLTELEKKLNFEQQRSDLWERLYIETKEQNEKLEAGNSHQEADPSKEGTSKGKTKKKEKDTFFNSVKDTFDAMKNSTKEFVRHHKEKIKQAKEAVKDNLKKFSDSVKNTFRHFKDTTRNMFDKNYNRKHAERRREETKGARTVRRQYNPHAEKMYSHKATAGHHEYGGPQDDQNSDQYKHTESWKSTSEEKIKIYPNKKGCSGVYDCAHQESISLFNKVLDPVRVEEFNDLMQVYLQEQVDNFQHWEELEQFINGFFPDGVFIHDQMLFTDFVKNVEDYLEDMKEYQTNAGGVFEDLDEFVYRHYFGNAYSTPYGPRKPERTTYKNSENKNHRKEEEKHQSRYKREGKWNKHGRANGRQMANVEIELGQLPFDPKY